MNDSLCSHFQRQRGCGQPAFCASSTQIVRTVGRKMRRCIHHATQSSELRLWTQRRANGRSRRVVGIVGCAVFPSSLNHFAGAIGAGAGWDAQLRIVREPEADAERATDERRANRVKLAAAVANHHMVIRVEHLVIVHRNQLRFQNFNCLRRLRFVCHLCCLHARNIHDSRKVVKYILQFRQRFLTQTRHLKSFI